MGKIKILFCTNSKACWSWQHKIFVFACKNECWLLFLEPKVLRALIKNFLVSGDDYSLTFWKLRNHRLCTFVIQNVLFDKYGVDHELGLSKTAEMSISSKVWMTSPADFACAQALLKGVFGNAVFHLLYFWTSWTFRLAEK